MKKISILFAIVLIFIFACLAASRMANTPVPGSVPPQQTATATEVKVLPTPSSPGNSITWDDLQVTMEEFEVTEVYVTDFGSTRFPPQGGKFLWIHIYLLNTGQTDMEVPLSEHYSVLYAGVELKPTYGHREGYKDYTALSPAIFPAQQLDGWLRFDIPATAELKDLLFVFIPESAQVGSSYGSPYYPYADDKPTYVWDYTP